MIALLASHREHPLQDTWATITKLRDSLNVELKKFRERQREIYPRLKLSALDVDEPELTAIQLPSYRMKHGQRSASDVAPTDLDSELREGEIRLRCTEADQGILAVRSACLALSAVKKTRELDYRGQNGITRSQRSLQKAELMKAYEIAMYNKARAALIHLGHMEKDAVEPYRLLGPRDTRRKETHLHRAKGDSRLFDGTAWYLQSGVTIPRTAGASTLTRLNQESDGGEEEPELLAGTQTLKRSSTSSLHLSSQILLLTFAHLQATGTPSALPNGSRTLPPTMSRSSRRRLKPRTATRRFRRLNRRRGSGGSSGGSLSQSRRERSPTGGYGLRV